MISHVHLYHAIFDGFEIYIINTMSIEHEDVPSMLLKFI